jgi:hypothetical protein
MLRLRVQHSARVAQTPYAVSTLGPQRLTPNSGDFFGVLGIWSIIAITWLAALVSKRNLPSKQIERVKLLARVLKQTLYVCQTFGIFEQECRGC